MNNDSTLKKTFDQEAELYNEIRPTYPAELFDSLVEATALSPDAWIWETNWRWTLFYEAS